MKAAINPRTIASLLLLLVSTATEASNTVVYSAEDLRYTCMHEHDEPTVIFRCMNYITGYIAGVENGTLATLESIAEIRNENLDVAGIKAKKYSQFCLPETTTHETYSTIAVRFVNYVEKNPTLKLMPAGLILHFVIRETFPCKGPTKNDGKKGAKP